MTDHQRTVILSRHPRSCVQTNSETFLVCPGDIAARQLGFPPVSLDELAGQMLERAGITIAPDHLVLRIAESLLKKSLRIEETGGMACALYPAINTLFRSGADLVRLARSTYGRPQLIAETANLLRTHLSENSYCAKADAITIAASGSLASAKISNLCLFGYARMSLTECRLVDTLAGAGSHIYLPFKADDRLFDDNQRAVDYFEAHGWAIIIADDKVETPGECAGDAFLGLEVNVSGVSARSYPTIEDEVRGVLRRVKRSLVKGEYGIGDVALVARTESSYGEWVREVAWEYELPVVTHYSITMLETRAGQWLNALLEVCETGDFPFEATARLFQHALGERLRSELLRSEGWNEARKEHTRGAVPWERLGLTVERLTWPHEDSRAGWCARVRAVMQDLQLRELSRNRPQDLDAYQRLYDALDEFSLPRAELLIRVEFISQLRDLLRVTSVASNTSSVGIEVHTPLSLYGALVPHVFVLGEAEGELPRPIADDAMLDFHDRKQLSDTGLVDLESAAQAARRETLSFYSLLLTASQSLSFSYPRMEGSSAVRPSPFIARMRLTPEHRTGSLDIAASSAEMLQYTLRGEASSDDPALVVRARMAVEVIERRERNDELDPYTGQTGIQLNPENRWFSPSQITTFGQCHYRWFANRLLKLGNPEEAEDDLAANLKGTLYHDVLKLLLDGCKEETDVRAAMLSRLERVFDEVANGMTELTRLAGWRGRRFELLAQLRLAISGEDFLREGHRVAATEQDIKGRWMGLNVYGRLDRIDRGPDGYIVIDYKTSGSPPKGAQDSAGKLTMDVQLPIYVALGASALKEAQPVVIGGYYYSLTKGKVLDARKPSDGSNQSGLIDLANSLNASVRSGSYPVAPDIGCQACEYCEFDILCRKGPHLFRNSEVEE